MLKKIMVVDDSELIHNMYRLMLKKYAAAEIISAKNGKEALDHLAREGTVDLVLLDVNMPIMNGIQFLQTIRERNLYADLPIIIISTEGKEEDTLRGLSLGARGYIVKPFKSIQLHELIDTILRSPQAQAL